MKKPLMLVMFLLFCSVEAAFAMFCTACGKEMPDKANFCPWCGMASAIASQAAEPAVASAPPAPVAALPASASVQLSKENYQYLTQMEKFIGGDSYKAVHWQVRKLQLQQARKMNAMGGQYDNLDRFQRWFHDLQTQKSVLLEQYFAAWQSAERNSDRARSLAEQEKLQFKLGRVNAMIKMLEEDCSDAVLEKIEAAEASLKKATKNYLVISKWLEIGNRKVKRGEPIWVIEIASDLARVMHMGSSDAATPACGWISVVDLAKRSNWQLDSELYPGQTPYVVYETRQAPTRYIIITDYDYSPRYRYFPPPYFRPPHHPGPGMHRPHGMTPHRPPPGSHPHSGFNPPPGYHPHPDNSPRQPPPGHTPPPDSPPPPASDDSDQRDREAPAQPRFRPGNPRL